MHKRYGVRRRAVKRWTAQYTCLKSICPAVMRRLQRRRIGAFAHPRCRSTISAVTEGGTRTAEDGGKSIRVPAEMTYAEYKAVYLDKKRQNKTENRNGGGNGKIEVIGKNGLNIQLFANDKLPDDAYTNRRVRQQVQNRHIEGTKEYKEYAAKLAEKGRKPSLLSPEIDVELFVRDFHGKGLYAPGGDGSPREIVDAGEVVGKYWNNRTNSYEETTFAKIIYSKKGVHIFPIFPGSKEED